MKTSTVVWIVIGILVLLGAWYWMSPVGSNNTYKGEMPAAGTQTNVVPQAAAPVVTLISDAKLGAILVASNGMTLYHFTKDTAGVSNCAGTCAANWPAYSSATTEPLVAGTGITGTLATITRADGSQQVTYNGMPLYFWKGDVKPGDTTGQGFGGFWFVVKP